jgi:hypothetical protein
MVRLTPRLEGHIACGYVGGAGVVLELVHQGRPIGDASGYPYLPLLEGRRRQPRASHEKVKSPSGGDAEALVWGHPGSEGMGTSLDGRQEEWWEMAGPFTLLALRLEPPTTNRLSSYACGLLLQRAEAAFEVVRFVPFALDLERS